jgi:sulfur carrier protein
VNVIVNGVARELRSRTTVAELVAELTSARRAGIAVAVNGEVVPRGEWDSVALGDDDRVEVLDAVQGG